MSDGNELTRGYKRDQALANGLLTDVSKYAQRMEFAYPIAVTGRVQEILADTPDQETHWDSLEKRTEYLLMLLRDVIRFRGERQLKFQGTFTRTGAPAEDPACVHEFVIDFSIDDEGQQVATIRTVADPIPFSKY